MAEIAIVGHEGVVGISLFMGGESTPSRAVVPSAGKGYRLAAKVLKDEFNRPPVLHLLLRYTQALITQMAQTAVCNRHHALDQHPTEPHHDARSRGAAVRAVGGGLSRGLGGPACRQ